MGYLGKHADSQVPPRPNDSELQGGAGTLTSTQGDLISSKVWGVPAFNFGVLPAAWQAFSEDTEGA